MIGLKTSRYPVPAIAAGNSGTESHIAIAGGDRPTLSRSLAVSAQPRLGAVCRQRPMSPASAGDAGREAFGRRAWAEAHAELRAADESSTLRPDDLERFAVVAQLVGRDDESARLWERVHQERLRIGDSAPAARSAFWLALGFMERGEMARAGGWLARARRILDDADLDCAEQGYVRIPAGAATPRGGRLEARARRVRRGRLDWRAVRRR